MRHHMHHHKHRFSWSFIGQIIGAFAIAALLSLVIAIFVQLLWNWLMPVVFGLPEIGYLQAFGLLVLAKIFFSGFKKHHSHRHHGHHGHHHHSFRFGRRCKNDTWKPAGDYKNWQYYEDYWQEEGKEAFENYLKRMNENSSGEKSDNG